MFQSRSIELHSRSHRALGFWRRSPAVHIIDHHLPEAPPFAGIGAKNSRRATPGGGLSNSVYASD